MKQITLVVPPDRAGTLADITQALATAQVQILELDATDDHLHAVVRLVAEPYDAALRALTAAGFRAVSESVILIRLRDEAGALAKVAARFKEAKLNVRTMTILRRDGGFATVAVGTDDNAQAAALLADCRVG